MGSGDDMKKKILVIAAIFAVLTAAAVIPAELFLHGVIRIDPSPERYPVRGIDVSSYQGDIDWEILSKENIRFVFIKATEGSSFVDRCFDNNFAEVQKTDLKTGAYHFFSYDSSGEAQADNFIRTVPAVGLTLPPVIDLEFYGDKQENPPPREQVRTELTAMLQRLEEHYGTKPIIYATGRSYSLYLSGEYEAYDIWIRNTIAVPSFGDGRQWCFWQYTDKAVLKGYHGDEKYIDMNVFHGTLEEFQQYTTERMPSK